jgi:hypothetical protein
MPISLRVKFATFEHSVGKGDRGFGHRVRSVTSARRRWLALSDRWTGNVRCRDGTSRAATPALMRGARAAVVTGHHVIFARRCAHRNTTAALEAPPRLARIGFRRSV